MSSEQSWLLRLLQDLFNDSTQGCPLTVQCWFDLPSHGWLSASIKCDAGLAAVTSDAAADALMRLQPVEFQAADRRLFCCCGC
jgi:hypothetical protein